MKKFIKIFIFTILIILFIFNYTYGFSLKDLTGTYSKTGDIETLGNTIIEVLLTIGSIISVIALIALGIKYMLGSVEERAEYKKTLMPYVIGAFFVFAASFIASIIYNIATQI